jgi:hypothetical protein
VIGVHLRLNLIELACYIQLYYMTVDRQFPLIRDGISMIGNPQDVGYIRLLTFKNSGMGGSRAEARWSGV